MIRDILGVKGCRYCLTDDTPFLFCNEPKMAGSSYCEDHHMVCHAGYGLQVDTLEKWINSADHSVAPRPSQPAAIVPVDEEMRRGE